METKKLDKINKIEENLKKEKEIYKDSDEKNLKRQVIPGDFSTTHIPSSMNASEIISKSGKSK